MGREVIERDESCLNWYRTGRRVRKEQPKNVESLLSEELKKIFDLIDAYESLLYVECVQYDQNDKRRSGEKRVRIIL